MSGRTGEHGQPQETPKPAITSESRVTYRKVASDLRAVAERTQSIYEVVLGEQILGRVVRKREATNHRAGARLRRTTTGTHWRYQSRHIFADGLTTWTDGPMWDASRDRAAFNLLRDACGFEADEIRTLLGKPATWL